MNFHRLDMNLKMQYGPSIEMKEPGVALAHSLQLKEDVIKRHTRQTKTLLKVKPH